MNSNETVESASKYAGMSFDEIKKEISDADGMIRKDVGAILTFGFDLGNDYISPDHNDNALHVSSGSVNGNIIGYD